MSWKCQKCGHTNPPTRDVYCDQCGTKRKDW
ncbi:MAG: zinc-ribbon domain-containing protein [SAR202 cluster bacterium]|nr:zinc-ribbon domain-containing protein [SAR202 cluster bacterium]